MQNKKIIISLGLILIVVLVGGFALSLQRDDKTPVTTEAVASTEPEATTEDPEIAAKLEEEKRLAEEKALEEARVKEEERQMSIKENTYFVALGGATVWSTALEDKTIVSEMTEKSKVYVSEWIKDAQGENVYAQIKHDIDAEETLGYVAFDDLVKEKIAFISKAYDDVDYSPFTKHDAFEENPKIDVKGVYVTGHSARGDRLDDLLALVDETDINAFVIDVKDDNGHLLFYSNTAETYNPEANNHVFIKDMPAFIEKMKAHNVYLIARIVTFKSPIYARTNPDRAIVYKGSQALYSDADKLIWASPHDRELWAYNVGVAKEAAEYGFNEIQFDYVRFPAIANKNAMDYKNETEESPSAAIQHFLKYAYEELTPHNVYIAADVFGWAATAVDDVGIGQHWESVANVVDYICPMMYPSHYGPNNFGLSVPDAFPYETIDLSVKDALARNANIETPGLIRPWIQDFTAPWVKGYIRYGAKEVRAQIDALKANGINEYLLWNAGNYYSKDALKND